MPYQRRMTRSTLARLFVLSFLPLSASAEPILVSGLVTGPQEEDQPLAGASVELAPLLPVLSEPVARARAGRDGRFEILAPEAGLWRLTVGAPGHFSWAFFLVPLTEDRELGAVQLTAAGVRTLTLRDGEGRPLAGAQALATFERSTEATAGDSPEARRQARLLASRREIRALLAPHHALSDEAGRIQLPCATGVESSVAVAAPGKAPKLEALSASCERATVVLAPGVERPVRVLDAGGRPATGVVALVSDLPVAGPSGADGVLTLLGPAGGALEVLLSAPAGEELALTLPPREAPAEGAPPVPVTLPALVVREGRVSSLDDLEPIEGAVVWPQGQLGPHVSTGRGGRFRLRVLPDRAGVPLAAAAAGFGVDLERTRHEPAGELVLLLRRALSVRGIVVDQEDRPMPGVSITAGWGSMGLARSRAMARAHSGPDGRFTLLGLDPRGHYSIVAEAEGYWAPELSWTGIEAGRSQVEARLVMRPDVAGAGRVVDRDGRPVAGASVYVSPSMEMGLVPRMPARERSAPSALTDDAGAYRLPKLPGDLVDLQADAPGFVTGRLSRLPVVLEDEQADLGTITLDREAQLTGRVVDRDGRPIEGAQVEATPSLSAGASPWPTAISGESDALVAESDRDGRFQLAGLVAGSTADLTARKTGYLVSRLAAVEVPADRPVRLVLEAGAQVRGRVVDEAAAPIEGALVHLLPPGASPGEGSPRYRMPLATSEQTGASGEFEVSGVEPGRYELTAVAEGYLPASLPGLDLGPRERREGIVLRLSAGAVLEGVVVDEQGRPHPRAAVLAEREDSDLVTITSPSAATDGAGRYRLAGLSLGQLSVRVMADGFSGQRELVEIRPGTQQKDFVLQRGVAVAGRLLDDTGAGVSGAWLLLTGDGETSSAGHTMTGPGGGFRIAAVSPGAYRLRVQGEGLLAPEEGFSLEVGDQPIEGLELVLSRGTTLAGRVLGLDPSQAGSVRVTATSGAETFASAWLDARGSFQLKGLAPGTWRVSVLSPATNQGTEATVEISAGQSLVEVELTLSEGLRLTGLVLANGAALPGAAVGVMGDNGSTAVLQTDAEGRFAFAGLRAGHYRVVFADPSQDRACLREIELRADDGGLIVDLAVEGRPAAELEGLVRP